MSQHEKHQSVRLSIPRFERGTWSGVRIGRVLMLLCLCMAVAVCFCPAPLSAASSDSADPGEEQSSNGEVSSHERGHQHAYTHSHWHTHVLEDGTVIHHSHSHTHTYWHYGPDLTERERSTRLEKNVSLPTEETSRGSAGSSFGKGETEGTGR